MKSIYDIIYGIYPGFVSVTVGAISWAFLKTEAEAWSKILTLLFALVISVLSAIKLYYDIQINKEELKKKKHGNSFPPYSEAPDTSGDN